jgi:excisionase family DNA binding protein
MAKPPPIFLTPKEIAARWRLSKSAIYRMKETGHLPYTQLGGAIRFNLADVEAYEAAGYQAAPIRPKVLRQKRRRAS